MQDQLKQPKTSRWTYNICNPQNKFCPKLSMQNTAIPCGDAKRETRQIRRCGRKKGLEACQKAGWVMACGGDWWSDWFVLSQKARLSGGVPEAELIYIHHNSTAAENQAQIQMPLAGWQIRHWHFWTRNNGSEACKYKCHGCVDMERVCETDVWVLLCGCYLCYLSKGGSVWFWGSVILKI